MSCMVETSLLGEVKSGYNTVLLFLIFIAEPNDVILKLSVRTLVLSHQEHHTKKYEHAMQVEQ